MIQPGIFLLSVFITIFILHSIIPHSVLHPDWLVGSGLETLKTRLSGIDKDAHPRVTDYVINAEGLMEIAEVYVPTTTVSPDLWSNYDRYESSTFSYDPYVPHNETNERVLDEVHEQAELRAIFDKKYCLNGVLKFPDTVSGPAPADATEKLKVLDGIRFQNGKKCDPCDVRCEFTLPDTRMTKEEFLVKPHDSNDQPTMERMEQIWRRLVRGAQDLFL